MAKKLLSALLAALMVLALVPMSVLAKAEVPTATKDERWEPATSVEAGEEYLIGYDDGTDTYLLMNYNPKTSNHYYYNGTSGSDSGYFGWGIKAVKDGEGKITGVDTTDNASALMTHVIWKFVANGEYFKIQSNYQSTYYLKVYGTSSNSTDVDCYASSSTTDSTQWVWDGANSHLYYSYTYSGSPMAKYVTYYASVGSYSNMFGAPQAAKDPQSNITLYTREKVEAEYTLTVNITYPAGHDPATETITRSIRSGVVVDLTEIIPAIPNFTSNYDGVTYTMPYHDDTINVTYSPSFNYAVNYEGETRTFTNDSTHPWTTDTGTGDHPYYAKFVKNQLPAVGSATFTTSFTAAVGDMISFDYVCYAYDPDSYGGTLSVALRKGEATTPILTDFYTNNSSWDSELFAITEAGSYTLEFSYNSNNTYSSTYYYACIDNVRIFTPDYQTLTINYVMPESFTGTAPETYTGSYYVGQEYSVTSPDVYGYEPDIEVVAGTMVDGGHTVTVTYTAAPTIDDAIKVGGFDEHFTTSSPKWTIVDATHPNPHYPDTVYDDHPSYAIAGNFNVDSSDSDLLLTLTGEAAAQLAGKKIKFDYLVDSENTDHGYFYVNGVQKLDAKGYTSSPVWKTFTYEFTDADVTSGTVELKWRYHKDGSIHRGLDVFYLDNVEIYAPVKNNVVISCVSGSDTLLTLSIPVEVGEAFNFAYPTSADHDELVGYRLASGNTPIEGTMGDTDVPFTVNYEPIPQHQLTISYTLDGKEFASPYIAMLYEGDTYNVKSPVFNGYTASQTTVYGTMGTENITVEVTYTANPSGVTVEEGWDFTGKTPAEEGFIIKNYTSGGWQNETNTLRAKWTSSSTEPANNYAATPAFTVSAGALLNFDVWRASTGFTEKLEVYVLTTEVADADELDAAITAGTELHLISDNPYTVNSTSSGSPDKLSFNLNAYAGQKVHIVFRHCSDGDQHSIYIDNIEIGVPVSETDPKIISGTVETRARTTDADTKTDVRFVIKVQFNESFISVVYPDATTEQFGDTTGKQIIGFGATLSFGFGSHADMELVGRNIWYVNDTYFTFTAVVGGILKTEFNGAATISATPYVKLLEGSTESTVTFATLTQKAEDL